ncbi:MAG: hypothetical protein HY238_14690 [Acidobacteria bacterium]|nr:hypothetical protein [Acidobacteriota bacterium]
MRYRLIRPVPEQELRRMFNQGQYYERTQTGELWEDPMADAHPSPERSHEPVCTHSQIIAYRDGSGKKVAVVHQYLRRDGKLGASGKPDPKWLLVDDVIYVPERLATPKR